MQDSQRAAIRGNTGASKHACAFFMKWRVTRITHSVKLPVHCNKLGSIDMFRVCAIYIKFARREIEFACSSSLSFLRGLELSRCFTASLFLAGRNRLRVSRRVYFLQLESIIR